MIMRPIEIAILVNKHNFQLNTYPNRTLLELLREDLGLTGTKNGCEVGECGACTVLMDGNPVNACLVLAGQVNGHEIETIEGLANDDNLHSIQQAFIENGAVQCGFCTPGMIMATKALLVQNKDPSRQEIKEALAGNLCRCTGYSKIFHAVEQAAREMRS
jgi:aerobic carbon-monoxide dehydrogenase small subunit